MRQLLGIVAFALALLAGAAGPARAAAGTKAELELENEIERRVNAVIQRFDPDALAFVTVELQQRAEALPGTPFTVSSLDVGDKGPQAKSVTIVLHTVLKPVPKDVLALVRGAADRFGVTPTVSVKTLPPKPALPEPAKAEPTKDGKTDAKAPDDEKKPEAVTKPEEAPKGLVDRVLDSPVLALVALNSALLALCGLGFMIAFMRSTRRSAAILDQGFKSVVSTFEETGGGRAPVPQQQSQGGGFGMGPRPAALPQGDTLKALGYESLRALLADCYWGSFDAYATYVWYRIPVEKRALLLEKEKYLADYVATLQGLEEQDLGVEQEPYYLSPLPLAHLDNEVLTGLVQQFPRLLRMLPTLRVDALKLTISERVTLLSTADDATADVPDFGGIKPSPRRPVKLRTRFKIQSVKEETDVLALPDLPVELRREIPTLAYLAELPPDAVREIFLAYTAQDLATAWIGPDAVLEKLQLCLPEKKLKLVLAYREKLQPSRDSKTFQALQQRAAELKFGASAEENAEKDHAEAAPVTAA